ncbi:hypothetical protein [Halogranum rubrum]|uniref:PRC-barrel domain-containing protein n=1 Tax=Halogranum salarium B-1 TaxID=1210908 RepID=J2ZWV8_9EURY|nr:hypothetical protein [Halogranum salarium]EJN57513.1 hypothetical protein HSB1_42010 [Halogranum salarium B-1]
MSKDTPLSEEDNGKRVVTSAGETVGHVVEVSGDIAYVDPDPESESAPTERNMTGADSEESSDDHRFPIEQDEIEAITDDELRLNR